MCCLTSNFVVIKELFSKRLKRARIHAALSQEELVSRIQGRVSKISISKYERGERLPSLTVLYELARALRVSMGYFFRESNVEIQEIEFRKKFKLGVKRFNAIREKVVDTVERYLELEQLLSINSEFQNPIAELVIKNHDGIEEAVNLLRKKWKLGLNALPSVMELLEDNQIKVIEIDAPEAFDGNSGWAENKFPVIVLNQNLSIEQKRLIALREQGYLLLNFSDQLEKKEVERKCLHFAAAMLIPEEVFKIELGTKRTHISVPELVSIKETYGISIQAIMARAKDLGVISKRMFIHFRKWISGNNTETGLGSYIGKENSTRFKRLLYRAVSEKVISLYEAANLSNQTLATFRKEFTVF